MAFNWVKIKNDWLSGMKNVEIQNKHNVSKAALQGKIKLWKAEEEKHKETKNSGVEKDAVSEVWQTLLDKDIKYARYTENQKMFVLYCAFGLTALEAYKRAGYSTTQKNLSIRASELKKKLMDAIIEAKKLVKLPSDIDQDDILGFMADVFNADVTDFLEYKTIMVDRPTKFGIIRVPKNTIELKDKDLVNTKLIKSIRISKDGNYELELYDKGMAIDFYTKYLNMFDKTGKDTAIESAMSKVLATIKSDGSNIKVSDNEDDDIISDEELESETKEE